MNSILLRTKNWTLPLSHPVREKSYGGCADFAGMSGKQALTIEMGKIEDARNVMLATPALFMNKVFSFT